jgi:hypothetical protein
MNAKGPICRCSCDGANHGGGSIYSGTSGYGGWRHTGNISSMKTNVPRVLDSPTVSPVSPSKYPHIQTADIQEYALPIIKEIGKALFPPAAIAIEVLYQLYTHADAIKGVASAVMEGDYQKAAAITTTEVAKEVAKTALGVAEEPIVAKASNSLAVTAAENIEGNVQEKEITGSVVKGTVRGVTKIANKEIVDKATNEVLKWKEEK